MSLLYNGIDLTRFQYRGRRSKYFSSRYGWSDECIIVGMTGQMSQIKGHFDLLEAARLLHERQPKIRFVIGGKQEGPYFLQLQRRIRDANLHHIVEFSGWQDDMPAFYGGLDIFVFPSRCDEAFGLVIGEAMAIGLPVVATRTGGPVEVVEDKTTGIVVDRESPAQLAEAIGQLSESTDERNRMGQEGRRRIEKFFDLSQQARQLGAILEDVAKSYGNKSGGRGLIRNHS
jgi:glycosyltransferase involved in cell wall biosynthesis